MSELDRAHEDLWRAREAVRRNASCSNVGWMHDAGRNLQSAERAAAQVVLNHDRAIEKNDPNLCAARQLRAALQSAAENFEDIISQTSEERVKRIGTRLARRCRRALAEAVEIMKEGQA